MYLFSDISDQNCGEGIFTAYPRADCILYDDEKCIGEEGFKVMTRGSEIRSIVQDVGFDVESVSLRAGCQLKIATCNKNP